MAADAIARQYDVDKNRVKLLCDSDKGSYRTGAITFFPKEGKIIDLRKMEESIRATRLSGGTAMSVDYLEITAGGEIVVNGAALLLKVSGSQQQFLLQETSAKDGTKTPLARLREALASGATVVSVTGRIDGWNGRFPAVLSALARQAADAPMVLFVSDFEASKK